MFKKSNAGDQLLLAVKLNKVTEISRLVALGVNVNSRIDKVKLIFSYSHFPVFTNQTFLVWSQKVEILWFKGRRLLLLLCIRFARLKKLEFPVGVAY